MGDYKAVRSKLGGPLELYDLAKDLGEEKNIADGQASGSTQDEAEPIDPCPP